MTAALRKAFDQHRDERANELFEIARILDQEGLSPDVAPIRQAAGQCRSAPRVAGADQPDSGRLYWGFEIADLRINLEEQRHCRPRSAVMSDVSGILSVTVQEYVPGAESQVGDSYTLLRRLDTDFFFDVFQIVGDVQHPLRAAWHLDTHLHTATATHGAHPRFHFQAGGERLNEIDEQIRGVFMPETPRVACAPLDAILAVDFVLAHYCGVHWSLLRDMEPRYGRLRKNPMQRYWSPYFRALAEGIDNLDAIPNGGTACTLIPNIFSD